MIGIDENEDEDDYCDHGDYHGKDKYYDNDSDELMTTCMMMTVAKTIITFYPKAFSIMGYNAKKSESI